MPDAPQPIEDDQQQKDGGDRDTDRDIHAMPEPGHRHDPGRSEKPDRRGDDDAELDEEPTVRQKVMRSRPGKVAWGWRRAPALLPRDPPVRPPTGPGEARLSLWQPRRRCLAASPCNGVSSATAPERSLPQARFAAGEASQGASFRRRRPPGERRSPGKLPQQSLTPALLHAERGTARFGFGRAGDFSCGQAGVRRA